MGNDATLGFRDKTETMARHIFNYFGQCFNGVNLVILTCLIHKFDCLKVNALMSKQIKDNSEVCITLHTPMDSVNVISGDYELLDDWMSANPLVVQIYSFMDGQLRFLSTPGASHEDFNVVGQGKFLLCLSNGLREHPHALDLVRPDGLDRNVGFVIRVRSHLIYEPEITNDETDGDDDDDSDINANENGNTTKKKVYSDRATHLLNSSKDIRKQLKLLLDHIEYLKLGEDNHQDFTSDIQSRIVSWTCIHTVALIAIALSQVFFWKKRFENL